VEPIFFTSPAEFYSWLEANHDSKMEVWVGFHKKATGKPTLTWSESVDQALCFGWIDGIRKPVDRESYKIRFTPRRKGSIWSAVNVKKVEALTTAGKMHEAGLKAYESRQLGRAPYSFENRNLVLPAEYEKRFRANKKAWDWFQSRAPGYRRTAVFWVMDAKREETRERRLETLITDCEAGRPIGVMRRPEA
jgi:uncharacterized protein YdeI (YjbR/CyaY-like superfamily)